MTQLCEEQRPLLIAYLKNELAPLESARLESHLARCRRCTALKDEVSRSFGAAKAWKPEVSGERMDQLVARLSPYIAEAERTRGTRAPFFALGGALAAGAAAIAIVVAISFLGGTNQPLEPAPARPEPSVIAVRPTPHIKLVASTSWDGRVDAIDATRSEISMSRGFAVVEFEGGQGRRLVVRAPGVTVEVVGTRFFVEVPLGGKRSIVGVTKGKVRVVTASRLDEIAAGQTKAYAESGDLAAESYAPSALGFVKDPAFADSHAPAASEASSATRENEVEGSPKAAGLDQDQSASAHASARSHSTASSEANALLARAEDRTRGGDLDGALALYRELADSPDPKLTPYRALARYETARILGFKRDDKKGAASILRDLAKNGGEVATEAAFALCELDLSTAPCRAADCLRAMTQAPSPRAVAKEARALLQRWGLDAARCPSR
jgi:ferric-dicitrate binding protein FerR (iron transport regulator)